jgi:multisubunit Na+/H+ antiporter MnhF subunit
MCNKINYNVIFLDKINFNIMTVTWIYYYMTKKHLFFVILLLYTE